MKREKKKSNVKPDEFVRFDRQEHFFADVIFSAGENEETSFFSFDPIERVMESEAYSFNINSFAERYVDSIVSTAVEQLKPKTEPLRSRDIVDPIIDQLINDYLPRILVGKFDGISISDSSSESFTGWPKISEFNIKLGSEKLEEYIKSWKIGENWMSSVEFLGFESEETSNYFVYEAEFTIPTPTYPIAQASASVYFSLEVLKMIPASYDRLIDVSYVFESSNVIHHPGKIDFQESWIRDIIHNKILLFRSVLF